jgi:SAM-dependent methyltransferase
MVLGGRIDIGERPEAGAAERAVIWHELECGSYGADLGLWRALADSVSREAAEPSGPDGEAQSQPAGGGIRRARILDVGAGTGRVARELARAGHRVTALDIDARLLNALTERDGGTDVRTVCMDARSFTLDERDFDACLVPMQTIQLLGGREQRVAFLSRAHAHVRPGGLVACALVTAVEPFDTARGRVGPVAESCRLGGLLYVSRPTRVEVRSGRVLIERERRVIAIPDDGPATETAPSAIPPERHTSELAQVSAAELRNEAAEVGLRARDVLRIAPTVDHVGSEVVIFVA